MLALALSPVADAAATTARIHYNAGSKGISVRADKGPMTWSTGAPAVPGRDHTWTYTWPDSLGDIAMKPALGEQGVSIGGVYKLAAGSTVEVYPFFGVPFGRLEIVDGFASPQLGNDRKLRIYLPASYDENKAKRYPVLYMQDAQNLFDAKTAAYGVEWGVDETVNRLVATGAMDEVIIVGIDNTPDRIAEYTPCCDPKYGGGKLDAYTAFMADTVKPYIDKTLRTLPDKQNTAIMGSSLGAIASVYIAQQRPDVFSKAGALSGSFWWNKQAMINQLPARMPVRFYLDAGTIDDGLEDTKLMRDALNKQGYRPDADLFFYEQEGGSHNEASWAERVEKPLTWFFPWGSTRQ